MKVAVMLRGMLLLSALGFAGEYTDNMMRSLESAERSAGQISQNLNNYRASKAQAKRDSIQRVADSIENEGRRIDLELKRLKLQRALREAREDSLDDAAKRLRKAERGGPSVEDTTITFTVKTLPKEKQRWQDDPIVNK